MHHSILHTEQPYIFCNCLRLSQPPRSSPPAFHAWTPILQARQYLGKLRGFPVFFRQALKRNNRSTASVGFSNSAITTNVFPSHWGTPKRIFRALRRQQPVDTGLTFQQCSPLSWWSGRNSRALILYATSHDLLTQAVDTFNLFTAPTL